MNLRSVSSEKPLKANHYILNNEYVPSHGLFCGGRKVAPTNPPRFALRPSQPDGWVPPAYGRGWPRFAVATFRPLKGFPLISA